MRMKKDEYENVQEDESKDEGILDRMDHSVNEVEEGKEIYMEEKSGR